MDSELWASLPGPLRTRIDELVIADRWFEAVKVLWMSGVEPRPGLNDCKGLIAYRYRELGDRVERAPEPARDLATLISQVNALPRRPGRDRGAVGRRLPRLVRRPSRRHDRPTG
ncbi:hypothetical protein ACRYCC_26965 [Actinomadura scrupuli]|uniref:hypothetical protein n=1 Tax=Actinomadura scrupuli TaxID=559629 RepID=UPI003D967A20